MTYVAVGRGGGVRGAAATVPEPASAPEEVVHAVPHAVLAEKEEEESIRMLAHTSLAK